MQHPFTELGTPLRVIEKVNPWYIAVGDGVQVFNSNLKFVRSFGIRGDPVDIDFDHQGNMYVHA